MSIFDLFSAKPATNEPAGNSPANDSKGGDNKQQGLSDSPPSVGPDGKMPGTNSAPENPLDVYAKMFENAAKNSGVQAPDFALDPKTVNEVAGKMDFTKDLPPELMENALKGDVKALLGVIQATSQNAYKAALSHGTALTDTFVKNRSDYDRDRLKNGVRGELTNQALSDAPNFDHPVIRQELIRVAEQFAKANPDASPKEIADSAKKYMTDIATALNPAAPKKEIPEGERDWMKYLSA
jgi:hypothetical protein